MTKIINAENIYNSAENIPYINDDGNIEYENGTNKVHLAIKVNDNSVIKLIRLSKDYYYIERISEDHFIICDAITNQLLQYTDDLDNSKLAFKYGVICFQRDAQGNIIPNSEKIVVPILYDKISINNENTITAYSNHNLTYIDIDPNSKNYGKQLVPLVLEHAAPFSVTYEGFAECSVNGVTGYLPRNCNPRTSLKPENLLTEQQVKSLLSVNEDTINKYSELVGSAKHLQFTKK